MEPEVNRFIPVPPSSSDFLQCFQTLRQSRGNIIFLFWSILENLITYTLVPSAWFVMRIGNSSCIHATCLLLPATHLVQVSYGNRRKIRSAVSLLGRTNPIVYPCPTS
jgi:hypothetical protein